MFPVIEKFPEFVPDQLLTSDNLNELFDFPDEQGRLTRTNLVGIGIVCGLEVSVNVAQNRLKISRGCGITSEGYLVSFKDSEYTRYQQYDALTEKQYAPFLKTSGGKQVQKFSLLELKKEDEPDIDELDTISAMVLANKVVLLFVELFEEKNKNCNPNSCDDKGVNITVNLKAMLVAKEDAESLIDCSGVTSTGTLPLKNKLVFDTNILLPELRMPRMVLPALPGPESTTHNHLVQAYQDIFRTGNFIGTVQTVLSASWTVFENFIKTEFSTNPFSIISTKFGFLAGTLSITQALQVQYYYDLFSDIFQAYQEFRRKGTYVLTTCCPDSNLFPRHLLLGAVQPSVGKGLKEYRHHFIYSPLFEKNDLLAELKTLFRRMVSLVHNFREPLLTDTMRITPSRLSANLSKKAIPFYYRVTNNLNQFPLYQSWNHERTKQQYPEHNLSYHAALYSTDDFIRNPLNYDLEDYDFFRIEGVAGRQCKTVTEEVRTLVRQKRLPVDVIPLRIGKYDEKEVIKQIKDADLANLEINYDIIRREWEAILGKTIEYLDDFKSQISTIIGSKTLLDFKKQLGDAKAYLKEQLVDFALIYEDFIKLYTSIEAEAERIRKMVDEKLALKPDKFLEDLIDHLDVVTTVDKKGSFRAVMQEFENSVLKIIATQTFLYRKAFFANYVVDHPGVEHKAGVSRGGTFILVYDKRSASDEPVVADFYLPYRCCSDAAPVQVLITEPNKPPVAAAGADQVITLPVNSVTLSGSATDADGNIMATWWSKKSGPANYDIETPEDLETKVTGLIPGVYVFELKVMDNRWDSHKDTVVVTVNEPPVARAGEDRIFHLAAGQAQMDVVLDGSTSSDPEGKELDYEWTRRSGPEAGTIVAPAQAKTTVKDLTAGMYEFQLKVVDEKGAIATDTVVITINISPTANAGEDKQVTLPVGAVILSGSGDDPDGTIKTFQWVKKSGPAGGVLVSPTAAQTNITGLVSGTYEYELTVTDNRGATGKDDVKVFVNEPPKVNAGPDQMIVMTVNSVMLNAVVSDDAGTVSIFWSKLTGGAAVIESERTATTKVSGLAVGEYVFEVVVTDSLGATAKDSVRVTVKANEPPKANAGPDQLIHAPADSTSLDGRGSTDPEGGPLSFEWLYVEGPTEVELVDERKAIAVVKGLKPGRYRFELTVTDNASLSSKDEVIVLVNQPPVVNAGDDQIIRLPEPLVLRGTGSDPEGGTVRFIWQQVSGPGVTIVSPNNLETQVLNVVPEKYAFRLTAIDDREAAASDSVSIVVNPGNQLPVANAGTDKVIRHPNMATELSGTFSDPDGSIREISWRQVDGPMAVQIEKPGAATTIVSGFEITGTYLFEFRVTDNEGASASDIVQVRVLVKIIINPNDPFIPINDGPFGPINPVNPINPVIPINPIG